MRVRTERFGLSFIADTEEQHSVKKTYKGSKLVRVNNIVESYQAGKLDAKEQRRIERKEQRKQRRQRQEPI